MFHTNKFIILSELFGCDFFHYAFSLHGSINLNGNANLSSFRRFHERNLVCLCYSLKWRSHTEKTKPGKWIKDAPKKKPLENRRHAKSVYTNYVFFAVWNLSNANTNTNANARVCAMCIFHWIKNTQNANKKPIKAKYTLCSRIRTTIFVQDVLELCVVWKLTQEKSKIAPITSFHMQN